MKPVEGFTVSPKKEAGFDPERRRFGKLALTGGLAGFIEHGQVDSEGFIRHFGSGDGLENEVDGRAEDVHGTNLFTGIFGNYLIRSIVNAGLDPANLPQSDPSKMSFGSGGNAPAKAWRDIWGSGQGIGAVEAVVPARELVARLTREYAAAKARVAGLE